ncbi:MAG: nuclear transport factor 2 family protein [Betaproteobacteria bacterium]|nr:nuclear transport factor 2 family protein [Betaproteobacteria bacterium]
MLNYIKTVLLGAAVAFATQALAGNCEDINAHEAQKAEDARYAAQMNDDFAAMDKLFADDLVYTHSSSVVDNKKTYIESMTSGTVKYKVMRRSDVTVRTFGCIAILTGLGNFDVRVKGQDLSVELRFSSTWIKRNGAPQFVSWQATRTPAKQ